MRPCLAPTDLLRGSEAVKDPEFLSALEAGSSEISYQLKELQAMEEDAWAFKHWIWYGPKEN